MSQFLQTKIKGLTMWWYILLAYSAAFKITISAKVFAIKLEAWKHFQSLNQTKQCHLALDVLAITVWQWLDARLAPKLKV